MSTDSSWSQLVQIWSQFKECQLDLKKSLDFVVFSRKSLLEVDRKPKINVSTYFALHNIIIYLIAIEIVACCAQI